MARTIVASALARDESRGAHFRSDFPESDDKRWLRYSVVRRGAEAEPKVGFRQVQGTRVPAEAIGSGGRQ